MATIIQFKNNLAIIFIKYLKNICVKNHSQQRYLNNFLERPLSRNSSEWLFPKKKQAVFQEQYKVLNVYSPVQKVKNKNIETKHGFSSKLKIKSESEFNYLLLISSSLISDKCYTFLSQIVEFEQITADWPTLRINVYKPFS